MASAGSQGVVLAAFMVSAGVAVAKLATAGASGSSALLASTVHSVADMSAMALLLFGLWRTRSDPAAMRPGSGERQLTFWGLVVPVLIYALAAGIALFEGIERLARPNVAGFTQLDQLLVGVSAALSVGYGWFALTRAQSMRQPGQSLSTLLRKPPNGALLAVLIVAAGAVAGQLAALFGMAVAAEANARADAVAAVLVALVLMAMSAVLALEIGGQLDGAAAHQSTEVTEQNTISAPAPDVALESGPPAPPVLEAALATRSEDQASVPVTVVPGQKPARVARQQGRRGHGKRRR